MSIAARKARVFRWSGVLLLALAVPAVPLAAQGYARYLGPHPELQEQFARDSGGYEFQLSEDQSWRTRRKALAAV